MMPELVFLSAISLNELAAIVRSARGMIISLRAAQCGGPVEVSAPRNYCPAHDSVTNS